MANLNVHPSFREVIRARTDTQVRPYIVHGLDQHDRLLSMTASSQLAIEHSYAQIGKVRLHYAHCGDGQQLVILLHGFPEFWYSWRHQLSVLGAHYHVVAPDMRGYNLSDKPSRVEDYQIELLVADVLGLITSLWKRTVRNQGRNIDAPYRELRIPDSAHWLQN